MIVKSHLLTNLRPKSGAWPHSHHHSLGSMVPLQGGLPPRQGPLAPQSPQEGGCWAAGCAGAPKPHLRKCRHPGSLWPFHCPFPPGTPQWEPGPPVCVAGQWGRVGAQEGLSDSPASLRHPWAGQFRLPAGTSAPRSSANSCRGILLTRTSWLSSKCRSHPSALPLTAGGNWTSHWPSLSCRPPLTMRKVIGSCPEAPPGK